MKNSLFIIFSLAFAITLSLNITGVFYSPIQKYELEHASISDAVPGYHNRMRSLDEIHEAIKQKKDDFDVRHATDLVFESLIHSGNRRIDIRENWLLWGLGLIYEPISRTQSPKRIVSGGVAICSEAAEVLNHLSNINGHSSRFIGLDGHVISEIQVDNKWYLADADYGITFPVGYLELINMDATESYQILQSLLNERGFDEERVKLYSEVLFTAGNNTVQNIQEKQSPRLWYIENIALPLKWGLTLIFGLISLVIYKNSRQVT